MSIIIRVKAATKNKSLVVTTSQRIIKPRVLVSGPRGRDGDVAGAAVSSVNGKTGAVVLGPDDLDDTSTAHKFVTSSEKTKLGNLSGTNTGDQDLTPYFNKSVDDLD